jgi:hypothetical protein
MDNERLGARRTSGRIGKTSNFKVNTTFYAKNSHDLSAMLTSVRLLHLSLRQRHSLGFTSTKGLLFAPPD